MGIYKLVLPKMGESVSEATITKWVKVVGDHIDEDDTIAEVATDKVDSEVPSPIAGTLTKILFEPNQVAQVGDVIAWIEVEGNTSEDDTAAENSQKEGNELEPETLQVNDEVLSFDSQPEEMESNAGAEENQASEVNINVPGSELLTPKTDLNTEPNNVLRFYSPLVRNIAQQEGLTQTELDGIIGTGTEGRVTKQDIFDFLAHRTVNEKPDKSDIQAPQPISPVVDKQSDSKAGLGETARATLAPRSAGDEIIEMDRMRKLIADHMVHSVKTSPHVASFVEADVTNIVNWRNKWKDSYKAREGENITFTPIFIEAICKALKDFPMVNVSIDGHNIIKKKDINIGMAAALPTGNLIVPVIRNADQLSLVGLSKSVNDLANRSRQNKLKPDDTQAGTFTFTNIGAFGNIMGVPIINQPQAAILAVGTIKKRPAVLETEHGDVIAIRHMMYLSMSYDHRIIDGALGGTFLKRVADYLEQWDINRVI